MTQVTHMSSPATVGYLRSASTGAFSTLIIFLLCWAGTAISVSAPFGLSYTFVGLFTSEPIGSVASLGIGAVAAFVTGGVVGAIIAHCYSLAGWWLGD